MPFCYFPNLESVSLQNPNTLALPVKQQKSFERHRCQIVSNGKSNRNFGKGLAVPGDQLGFLAKSNPDRPQSVKCYEMFKSWSIWWATGES